MTILERDEALEIVGRALIQAPRVLILGQYYLGRSSSENPFFAAVCSTISTQKDPYAWWLNETEPVEKRAKTLASIEDSVIVDPAVIQLLRLQWTAVFTSAIDSLTRRVLRIPEVREVHQVFRPSSERRAGGSIPVFRLFGSVDRSEAEELPPANSESDLRRRRRLVASMLDYVPEIVAEGNLFVEGWWPSFDWLRPRELSSVLAALARGQAYFFGADDAVLAELQRDEDFADSIEAGTLRLVRPSLVEVVSRLTESGWVAVQDESAPGKAQVVYPIVKSRPSTQTLPTADNLTTLAIPALEWRRLSDGAKILTELDPTKPLPDSTAARTESFRAFTGGDIRWEWLDHFAFRRPILNSLFQECRKVAEAANPEEHTFVVYGQSGSGKTVLLSLLALDLRRMGLPVVSSGPSILPVNREHIEAFCEFVSSASSAPVFLINDGARDDNEYLELSSYLASRARSCVVVGSSYPSQRVTFRPRRGTSSPTLHPIALPVKLGKEEGEALLKHLSRFIIDWKDAEPVLFRFLGEDASNFFALIYRLLPESRPRGRKGIVTEFTESSRKLQERLQKLAETPMPCGEGTLGQALRQALGTYLFDRVAEITQPRERQASADVNDALRMINAVMVVSQLGLQVPQSLVLRLIAHNIPAYRNSVEGDILDVVETREGTTVLQARHALEASIWVNERLPKLEDQFALVTQLVKQIREAEVRNDQAVELEFVAQVLRTLGPQGPERFRRPRLYPAIAGLIAELRELHGEVHPRLLLIESNATREGIKNQQWNEVATLSLNDRRQLLDDWIKRLESAEDGLRVAQEMVLKPIDGLLTQGARRMLATLATERAGVVGFMIGSLCRALPPQVRQKPEWTQRADAWLKTARSFWRDALAYDDANVNAIDTACWVLAERYDVGGLGLEQEAELFADWAEAIDRYNERDELSPVQLDTRDRREGLFAGRIGDLQRFASVMERAAGRGSSAVHILKARLLQKEGGATAARDYLEEKCGAGKFTEPNSRIDAQTDRAVLLLYYRLWWQSETGFDVFFPEERLRLKFSRQKWQQLLNLCQARLNLEGEREHSTSLFLSACALFHLGRIEEGEKIFDHLDRLGVGGVRRSRALILLSDEKGNPRQLMGEFQGRRRGQRLLAWCDELRTNIPFNPLELVGPGDIKTGRRIGPFHLSLRFRGPYGEPLHRLRWHQKGAERPA